MTSKIFSFVKNSSGSIVASVRIARFVSEELGLPIVDDGSIADEKLDVLVIINGAFAFCKCLQELGEAIKKAGRVVWCQNDYTIIIPKEDSGAESPFRKAFRDRKLAGAPRADMWTTCATEQNATPQSHYINFNCLTLDDAVADDEVKRSRKSASPTLFYYGSFRTGRSDAFDRYFKSPSVETVISSPSKKFSERYSSARVVHESKIEGSLTSELQKHGLGLYLEDRKSHSEFHSPANRFYEMLSAGLPIAFQPECGASLRKGGYDPTPFVVESSRGLPRAMDLRDAWGQRQRLEWLPRAREERAELTRRVHAAWAKLEDQL